MPASLQSSAGIFVFVLLSPLDVMSGGDFFMIKVKGLRSKV